jgi:hypothetical protein
MAESKCALEGQSAFEGPITLVAVHMYLFDPPCSMHQNMNVRFSSQLPMTTRVDTHSLYWRLTLLQV